MADEPQQGAPTSAPTPDPATLGSEQAVQAKRGRLVQAASAPAVGRRPAQPDPEAPARRRRLLVGLALSAVVVVAAVALVMGLAADISL